MFHVERSLSRDCRLTLPDHVTENHCPPAGRIARMLAGWRRTARSQGGCAMKDKPRLGRGIEALMSGDGGSLTSPVVLPIERIQQNPFQPRKAFDPEELGGLCESIRSHGLLQPLVVRMVGDQYQLVAGGRRLRAGKMSGTAG